jgi:hypothetical protein
MALNWVIHWSHSYNFLKGSAAHCGIRQQLRPSEPGEACNKGHVPLTALSSIQCQPRFPLFWLILWIGAVQSYTDTPHQINTQPSIWHSYGFYLAWGWDRKSMPKPFFLLLSPTWCTTALFCNIRITLDASTCFEQIVCSSSGGPNSILQHLVCHSLWAAVQCTAAHREWHELSY